MQYLQQKSGAQTQQEFEAYIQQLGEEGLRQEYAQFMQLIQQQQVASRKFGGMLNYIEHLRGVCPEGYEMQFFKQGGRVCKKCMKKVKADKCGGKTKKVKKAMGGGNSFSKVNLRSSNAADKFRNNPDETNNLPRTPWNRQQIGDNNWLFDPRQEQPPIVNMPSIIDPNAPSRDQLFEDWNRQEREGTNPGRYKGIDPKSFYTPLSYKCGGKQKLKKKACGGNLKEKY